MDKAFAAPSRPASLAASALANLARRPPTAPHYLPANTGLPSAWIAPQLLRIVASTAAGIAT